MATTLFEIAWPLAVALFKLGNCGRGRVGKKLSIFLNAQRPGLNWALSRPSTKPRDLVNRIAKAAFHKAARFDGEADVTSLSPCMLRCTAIPVGGRGVRRARCEAEA